MTFFAMKTAMLFVGGIEMCTKGITTLRKVSCFMDMKTMKTWFQTGKLDVNMDGIFRVVFGEKDSSFYFRVVENGNGSDV